MDLIEPKIEPLVRAVLDAGFVMFSSCEGHRDYEVDPPRFACIAFSANEEQAREVYTTDALRLLYGSGIVKIERYDCLARKSFVSTAR